MSCSPGSSGWCIYVIPALVGIVQAVLAAWDNSRSTRKCLAIWRSIHLRPFQGPQVGRLPTVVRIVGVQGWALKVPAGPHYGVQVRKKLGCFVWLPGRKHCLQRGKAFCPHGYVRDYAPPGLCGMAANLRPSRPRGATSLVEAWPCPHIPVLGSS